MERNDETRDSAEDKARPAGVAVFFYGLFMDTSLLASKGIPASRPVKGRVDGYGLRIGNRATLVADESRTAYGVLMTLRAEDLNALYSDESVADYVPETVSVRLPDGVTEFAVCYNLPVHKLQGANPGYAKSLLALAGRLGFPDDYLEEIREQTLADGA